jgi:hypothetical protein
MKIEIEIKDNPRGRPTVKAVLDQSVHHKLHVSTVVSALKKQYPWAKIIDLRIDLR